MRKLMTAVLIVAGSFPLMAALATQVTTVVQKNRRFDVQAITIAHGSAIKFTNEDDFAHQLNIRGPGMAIDSDMQEEGEVVSIPFPQSGKFDVRCGIHPRMRLTVEVE